MKKILFVIVLFLAGAKISLAQSGYTSLLWEVTGKELRKPAYLYGTMHSFEEKAFRYSGIAEKYIKKSDVFAMELQMDSINVFAMLPLMNMAGDTTLQMLMDSATYQRIDTYMMDSMSMSLSFFSRIKPFFLMAMMTESDMFTSAPDETDTSARGTFLDQHLADLAKKHHKKVIGLETAEEQMTAVDGIPLKEQAEMLVESIDSIQAGVSEEEKILEIYEKGDLNAIYELYLNEELSNGFTVSLIVLRNHRMSDRIEEHYKKGKSLFAAVGAMHLPGDEGIIELLRKKGYTVTPIALTQ